MKTMDKLSDTLDANWFTGSITLYNEFNNVSEYILSIYCQLIINTR
jgi:hypothetical protein